MPANWPATLPATPLINGYDEKPQNSLSRFSPDAGKPKQRNLTTAMPSDVSEQYVLTNTQWDTLESFWASDCNRGATSFLKTHPYSGLSREYIFVQPPEPEFVTTDIIRVSLRLELLP